MKDNWPTKKNPETYPKTFFFWHKLRKTSNGGQVIWKWLLKRSCNGGGWWVGNQYPNAKALLDKHPTQEPEQIHSKCCDHLSMNSTWLSIKLLMTTMLHHAN